MLHPSSSVPHTCTIYTKANTSIRHLMLLFSPLICCPAVFLKWHIELFTHCRKTVMGFCSCKSTERSKEDFLSWKHTLNSHVFRFQRKDNNRCVSLNQKPLTRLPVTFSFKCLSRGDGGNQTLRSIHQTCKQICLLIKLLTSSSAACFSSVLFIQLHNACL